jgi:hypothetical protein
MVANHGKFAPDVLAQKAAGHYNSGDTFNEAMLLKHFENHASAQAYDGQLLRTWKEATPLVFKAVEHITQYRRFLLVADDRQVSLAEAVPPADYVDRYPDAGAFFNAADVEKECVLLKQRSLQTVMAAIRDRTYTGIGAAVTAEDGSCVYTDVEARLFPTQLKKPRTVRLFKKLRESDTFWIEQESYMKTADPREVCAALAKVVPYCMSTIPGQCARPYWGARVQQIKDQHARYIPIRYVPDHFALGEGGLSRSLSASVQRLLAGAGVADGDMLTVGPDVGTVGPDVGTVDADVSTRGTGAAGWRAAREGPKPRN